MSIVGACMVPHPPIILPEVGGGEEEKISATAAAYRAAMAEMAALKPEVLLISTRRKRHDEAVPCPRGPL